MTRIARCAIAFAGTLMMLTATGTDASAQDRPRPGLEPDAPSYFEKGTWTLELGGGAVQGISPSDSTTALGTLGVGYYFANTLALRLEAAGYGFWQESDDAWGGGMNLMLRHHLFNSGEISLFIDGGSGLVESSRRVPPGGTHFNFASKVGLGLTWRLDDRLHLVGGARYFHLSNARIHGKQRNPGIDGVEGSIGAMWEL